MFFFVLLLSPKIKERIWRINFTKISLSMTPSKLSSHTSTATLNFGPPSWILIQTAVKSYQWMNSYRLPRSWKVGVSIWAIQSTNFRWRTKIALLMACPLKNFATGLFSRPSNTSTTRTKRSQWRNPNWNSPHHRKLSQSNSLAASLSPLNPPFNRFKLN